jgi:hypothetical protein
MGKVYEEPDLEPDLVLYDILLIAVHTVLKKDTYSGKDQEEKEQIRNFCYYYYIHMNYLEKVSGRVLEKHTDLHHKVVAMHTLDYNLVLH